MDIFAHGIWSGIGGKIARLNGSKIKLWKPVLWGMFPDLFAFTLLFGWLVFNALFGTGQLGNFEKNEPAVKDTNWITVVTSMLYSFSHSIFIFGIIFLVVYVILGRFVWEMLGWLGHIIVDIPTHSYKFYPTPFLWPFSKWKFDGISWGNKWFMIANYSLIVLFLVVIWWKGRKKLK